MYNLQKLIDSLKAADVLHTEEEVMAVMHHALSSIRSESPARSYQSRVDILTRRYGLQGFKPHTLKELSELYSRSRDIIRQIEGNSIRRMYMTVRTVRNNLYLKSVLAELRDHAHEPHIQSKT